MRDNNSFSRLNTTVHKKKLNHYQDNNVVKPKLVIPEWTAASYDILKNFAIYLGFQ